MPQPEQPGRTASSAPESHLLNVQPTEMTAWVGWIAFAGMMMILLGTFHAIQGLVALFQDEYFLVAKSGLVVHVDYTNGAGLTSSSASSSHLPESRSSPGRSGHGSSAS